MRFPSGGDGKYLKENLILHRNHIKTLSLVEQHINVSKSPSVQGSHTLVKTSQLSGVGRLTLHPGLSSLKDSSTPCCSHFSDQQQQKNSFCAGIINKCVFSLPDIRISFLRMDSPLFTCRCILHM